MLWRLYRHTLLTAIPVSLAIGIVIMLSIGQHHPGTPYFWEMFALSKPQMAQLPGAVMIAALASVVAFVTALLLLVISARRRGREQDTPVAADAPSPSE